MSMGAKTSYRFGTVHTVAYTGTHGVISGVISNGVYQARIYCTTDAHVLVGTAPTATTSSTPVTGGVPEYINVNPGEKVSAVQQSAGGTLFVTELSA